MDLEPKPVVLGPVYDPVSLGLPPWCKGYVIRRDADGRLYAVSGVDGVDVYVIPRAWNKKPAKPDTTANFGVLMTEVHGKPSGTLTTNDPTFRPVATKAGSFVVGAPASLIPPAKELIVPGVLCAFAALVAFRRRRA